jgi:hypothetical protein
VKDTDDIRYFDQIVAVARNRVDSVIDQTTRNLIVGTGLPKLMRDRWQIEIEPAPIIVPPGFYKAEHHEALKEIWRAAAQELSDAEDIIVIGFRCPLQIRFLITYMLWGLKGGLRLENSGCLIPTRKGQWKTGSRRCLALARARIFTTFP